ncbi:hypothetical protein PI125_g18330 [Phytophthora idaei]|nr:hypothetical protein PI125_g18330 [Phytophthora idaei]
MHDEGFDCRELVAMTVAYTVSLIHFGIPSNPYLMKPAFESGVIEAFLLNFGALVKTFEVTVFEWRQDATCPDGGARENRIEHHVRGNTPGRATWLGTSRTCPSPGAVVFAPNDAAVGCEADLTRNKYGVQPPVTHRILQVRVGRLLDLHRSRYKDSRCEGV